jgi:hypothetical protein
LHGRRLALLQDGTLKVLLTDTTLLTHTRHGLLRRAFVFAVHERVGLL